MQKTIAKTAQVVQQNLDHSFFSWSKQGGLNPLHIKSAKGVYLHDYSGRKYLDFSSQLMNVNIGHGQEAVAEAVQKQMQNFSFVAPSMATDARGQLAAKLAEITPADLSKSFFTLGGAEAIENAIKLARIYTGKYKILTHYRSYHGATMGAISAGGDPRRHPVDSQQMPNIVHFENPYYYRCPWYSDSMEQCGARAIRNLEQIIQYEKSDTIAAILVEGESGTSGCIKYPPFYLKKIRQLCDKYNILMITDEVMSGFARTGKWFGVDHHDVTPDIMCMAKGLTSGYIPLGAMVVREAIAKVFDDQVLPLGLTYSAHTVSCAAANAVLQIYEEQNLVNKAAENGQYLDQKMEELMQKHPSIGDWRNTGMLGAIELVRNRETKEAMSPWNQGLNEPMSKVAAKIRELGMFTFVKWNLIFVAPPLIATKAELDEGLAILSEAISIADQYCE